MYSTSHYVVAREFIELLLWVKMAADLLIRLQTQTQSMSRHISLSRCNARSFIIILDNLLPPASIHSARNLSNNYVNPCW